MKYVIELHGSDYRGDHAADVVIAHEPIAYERVTELVGRLLPEHSNGTDCVVLRRVVPAVVPITTPDAARAEEGE